MINWRSSLDFKSTRRTNLACVPTRDQPAHGQAHSPRVWAPLRSAAFASLFAGYALSALGNGMSAVAISWLAIELAHGHDAGLLVGAVVAAFTLPGVLAAVSIQVRGGLGMG